MRPFDHTLQRLFVDEPLFVGSEIRIEGPAAHYVANVLRLRSGQSILVFNGRDGEWRAEIGQIQKKSCVLLPTEQVRSQEPGPDIDCCFAPLKRARLDYMVQKATELGASRLRPVMTTRTVAERVNTERMRANVIEAAEQCGILRIPEVHEPQNLAALLEAWQPGRRLVLCDESADVQDPLAALGALAPGPVAVLIGPEGGFTPQERALLLQRPFVTAISLGPRIMRADTAAVAALTLINVTLGDWRGKRG